MPLLVYSYPDFTANTVIASAKVNAKYNDIKTLLNTTGLDDTNIQDAGITRATKLKTGTANYVVINGSDGKMSEEATLSPSRGGLGISYTPVVADAGKVVAVASDGSGFTVENVPDSNAAKLYAYTHLT